MRDAEKINRELGVDPLPHNMQALQIMVFNNEDVRDDSDYGGCPLIEHVDNQRIDDPQIWAPYD